MNAVKNDAVDLIFRMVDSQNHSTLIPVKTASCKLAKKDDHGNQICCTVQRDSRGATIQVLAGDVFVNGKLVQQAQLYQGDQICLADSCYQISQLGVFKAPHSTDSQSGQKASIDTRFREIQTELNRQNENFHRINQKFEQMSEQIASLLNTVTIANSAGSISVDSIARDDDADRGARSGKVESLANPTDNPENVQADVEETGGNVGDCRESIEQPPADNSENTDANGSQEPTVEDETELNSVDANSSETDWDHQADMLARLNALTNSAAEETEYDAALPVDDVEAVSTETLAEQEINDGSNEENPTGGAGDLEQLLASLNNAKQVDVENSLPQEPSSSASTVEDSAEPVAENEQLENLFASLRQKDEEPVEDDAAASASAPIRNEPEIANDMELIETEFETDPESTESSHQENHLQELSEQEAYPVNSQDSDVANDEDQDTSPQNTERKLLDQLRSLQREQAAIVEQELKAEAEASMSSSEQAQSELIEQAPLDRGDSELNGGFDEPQVQQEILSGNESSPTESEIVTKQESVTDILKRMNGDPSVGESHQAESSEHLPKSLGSMEQTQDAPMVASLASPKQEESGVDVQDYMNSLLQRLNGGATVSPAKAIEQPVVEAPVVVPEHSNETSEQVVSEDVMPLNPEDFVPKQVAPEVNSNLAAMRELANATSRNAVKRSQLQRKKDAANSLLLGAGGAIVAAVCTTFMTKQPGDIYYWLSILFFGVTAVCSGIYVKDMLFSKDGKKQDKKPSFDLMALFHQFKSKWNRSSEADS